VVVRQVGFLRKFFQLEHSTFAGMIPLKECRING
jgi:hypothetical protein